MREDTQDKHHPRSNDDHGVNEDLGRDPLLQEHGVYRIEADKRFRPQRRNGARHHWMTEILKKDQGCDPVGSGVDLV